MVTRRSFCEFNWYDVAHPYWLVRADTWHCPLKIVHLPPGSDLDSAFLNEALEIHREGWRLREFTMKYGFFIAHRDIGGEVLHVTLVPQDPRRSGQSNLRQL